MFANDVNVNSSVLIFVATSVKDGKIDFSSSSHL
jgi:hypothetical protein